MKEKPLRINERVFYTFEEFRDFLLSHRPTKEEVLKDLEEKMANYECKYKMSTEEFVEKIVGTPEDDEPDFIMWLGHYKSYTRLKNGEWGWD